ncbi:MAG: glucosaminidase domain-containing protein [Roseiflexaceae bacterium]
MQQRKPLRLVVASEPLLPTPTPAADTSPQPSEMQKTLDNTPTPDQQAQSIANRSVQQSGVSEQKKGQISGGASSSRPRFEHIEHRSVRADAAAHSMPVAQGAAYPHDERYRTHAPIHNVYQPWEMLRPAARGQFFVLLLISLVCLAVIWMFLQSPKAFISTYNGSKLGNAVSDAVSGFLSDQAAESHIASANVPAGEHSVLGDPSINAAAIDTILSAYGSPAVGTGQAWIKLGQQYGIDPAYAVAFFIHESSAGTNPGWAGMKSDGSTTHNVGNIICAGYATCYNRFRDYASWDEGIADWYKLISHEYVDGRGAASIEQIIPIYAPSSDNNDVPGYINVVVSMVEGWRQGVIQ